MVRMSEEKNSNAVLSVTTYLNTSVTIRSKESLTFIGDVVKFPFEKMNDGASVSPHIGVFLTVDDHH